MKSVLGNRKLIVSIFVVRILASSALALGPLAFSVIMGAGGAMCVLRVLN